MCRLGGTSEVKSGKIRYDRYQYCVLWSPFCDDRPPAVCIASCGRIMFACNAHRTHMAAMPCPHMCCLQQVNSSPQRPSRTRLLEDSQSAPVLRQTSLTFIPFTSVLGRLENPIHTHGKTSPFAPGHKQVGDTIHFKAVCSK